MKKVLLYVFCIAVCMCFCACETAGDSKKSEAEQSGGKDVQITENKVETEGMPSFEPSKEVQDPQPTPVCTSEIIDERFNTVFDFYYNAITDKYDRKTCEEHGVSGEWLVRYKDESSDEILAKVGFCSEDINGDGIDELLVGDVNAGDVYDIFVNNTCYISNVASLQEDQTVFVYENGRYAILYTYHGEDEEYDFYYIDESGNPVCECALRISNYNDKDGGEYSVFYDESKGYESITPQEAADILNGYGEKRLFEFTPFSSVMGEDYAK